MIKKYYNLGGGGKAYFLLDKLKEYKLILAIAGEDEIPLLQDNLKALGRYFGNPPVRNFLSYGQYESLATLNELSNDYSGIVLTTPQSAADKTISPQNLQKQLLTFESGKEFKFETLINDLAQKGYLRVDFVEEKGQFARRGEILDIWAIDQVDPWRVLFNYNIVETIRSFDVSSQRSGAFVKKVVLLPAKGPQESLITGYLSPGTAVYVDSVSENNLILLFEKYDILVNNSLSVNTDAADAGFKSLPRWGGNYKIFLEEFQRFEKSGFHETIFCSNDGEKERIQDIFSDSRQVGNEPEIEIGPLAQSFYSNDLRKAFFSAQEILYRKRPLSFPKFKSGRRLEGLWEISPQDYVVHEKYGIGRYLGLKRIARGEQESEYLCLEYKGGDKLYIPVDDFHVVQKYIGVEGHRPKLYSLDTAAWERTKQKAKEEAAKFAEELIKLYAERKNVPGHSYPGETVWEKELADSFGYTETEDQLRTINEVKDDLEKPNPMERIVCGDVGFGKTEVAVRAAFKVALNNKQVAVLVPTTVLAEQHFATFSNRLAPFPIKVEMLSRFQTKSEQKRVLQAIKSGTADIIIGTHRLLQKDIVFDDLGLLVIDEEHRFGVKQKEKIKSFKKNVDVLLLSATPIPRTLSFGLSGLRDLSVIETPPYGRLPIETHLGLYDEKIVARIIQAEIARSGQVFYVHNRVETIGSRADYLRKLVPDIRIGIVHGQLPAAKIEKAMWMFLHKQIDVLIATTIIESGLDIPSVNTMIVEEAEDFGLSQLYQLRGRIGREKQKAYCYLFYSNKDLSPEAVKRLEALQDLSELGSGFRLALRDMEIRGAGNILGAQQHGFAKEIGFELYSRLLSEASGKIKPQEPTAGAPKINKVVIDFNIAAYLPDNFIETQDLRIIFYRRMADALTDEELNRIKDELIDRFGVLPQPAENLFLISSLRIFAQKKEISRISEDDIYISIFFASLINIPPGNILKLTKRYEADLEFIRGETPGVRLRKKADLKETAEFIKQFLLDLTSII